MIQDLRETLESFSHGTLATHLAGTLAAGDYLGDTAAGTGVALPHCTLETAHYNAATASGTDTEITVHNVTQETSAAFTPDSSAGSASLNLVFDASDELAVEVTGVDGTTAGGDVAVTFEYRKHRLSSTTYGR